MVPNGGVNLETAVDYIKAGAAALGSGRRIGAERSAAIPEWRTAARMAKEFVELVKRARNHETSTSQRTTKNG